MFHHTNEGESEVFKTKDKIREKATQEENQVETSNVEGELKVK